VQGFFCNFETVSLPGYFLAKHKEIIINVVEHTAKAVYAYEMWLAVVALDSIARTAKISAFFSVDC